MKHLLSIALTLFILTFLSAQEKQDKPTPTFDRRTEMIAMRDGVKLNTLICTPKDQKEPLPFIMIRTPYGVDNRSPLSTYTRDLANEGYIFVFRNDPSAHRAKAS